MNIRRWAGWGLSIAVLVAWLIGCSEEPVELSAPTGMDRLVVYERSAIPGIQVYVDLNSHHLAGQPYGSWQVNASWRDQKNEVLAAIDVPMAVTGAGIGTALLPADFLNYVFRETHTRFVAGDSALWTNQPGLYLYFYADEATYAFFDGFNVVGGTQADGGDWPWIAGLIERGKSPASGQFCGGSLIHADWVVTAAHCLEGDPPMDVIIGTDDLNAPADSYDRIAVIKQIAHPAYNPGTLDNDIALLRLARPANAPTLAWDRESLARDGSRGKVAGWGATDAYGTALPTRLMEVELPIISNAACNQSFQVLFSLGPGVNVVSGNMFCAGYAEGGKDSCVGDSGGPFLVDGKLAGLVSWGPDACAQPNAYGVYTRVSNYTAWLNSMLQTDVPTDFTNGWYYGGSLYDMVTQLGVNWHPSSAPIQDLGVSMSIGFVQ